MDNAVIRSKVTFYSFFQDEILFSKQAALTSSCLLGTLTSSNQSPLPGYESSSSNIKVNVLWTNTG